MNQSSLKIIVIKKNEIALCTWLFLLSFCLGLFVVFFFTKANTELLSLTNPVTILPLAYTASGILGYFLVRYFTRNLMNIGIVKLYQRVAIISASVMVIFDLLLRFSNQGVFRTTVTIALYAMTSPVLTICALMFSGLVLNVFDITQGKRLFALLSTGETIASILGYILAPLIAKQFTGHQPLLLFAAGGMALVTIVFKIGYLRFSPILNNSVTKDTKNLPPRSLKVLLKEKYFLVISFIVTLSIICIYFIDFGFLLSVRGIASLGGEYQKTNSLSFFAYFFAAVKTGELIFSFLSGKVLQKLGMLRSLATLPVILTICALFSVVTMAYFAMHKGNYTILLFFPFLFAKFFDRTIRKSIEIPSLRTLYQPVPASKKVIAQSFIDGILGQIAILISGILLLSITYIVPFFSTDQSGLTIQRILMVMSVPFFILTSIWIVAAFFVFNAYKKQLGQFITLLRNENSDSLNVVKNNDNNLRVENYQYLADLLFAKENNSQNVMMLIEKLISSSNDENIVCKSVCCGVPGLLSDQTFIATLDHLASKNHSEIIRNTAKKILSNPPRPYILSDLTERSPIKMPIITGSTITVVPNKPIIVIPGIFFGKSRLARIDYSQAISDDKLLRHSKTYTSATINENPRRMDSEQNVENSLKIVNRNLSRATCLEDQISLVNEFRKIGAASMPYLEENLNTSSDVVLFEIIHVLDEIGYQIEGQNNSEIFTIVERIAERLFYLASCKEDLGATSICSDVVTQIHRHYNSYLENLFICLGWTCGRKVSRDIRAMLLGGASYAEMVFSQELLDTLLSDSLRLKNIVQAVLTIDIAISKIKSFANHFPQQRLSVENRLCTIISKDYTAADLWLKANALQALSHISTISTRSIQCICSCLWHPEALIYETAAFSLNKISPQLLEERLSDLPSHRSLHLRSLINVNESDNITLFEIVKSLQSTPIFSNVPEYALLPLGRNFKTKPVRYGKPLQILGNNREDSKISLIIQGRCEISSTSLSSSAKNRYQQIVTHSFREYEQYESVDVYPETKIAFIQRDVFYAIVEDNVKLKNAFAECIGNLEPL